MQRYSVPFHISNGTYPSDAGEQPDDSETSGHVERIVLHHVTETAPEPTTLGDILDDVAAVIARGGYGNAGPPWRR